MWNEVNVRSLPNAQLVGNKHKFKKLPQAIYTRTYYSYYVRSVEIFLVLYYIPQMWHPSFHSAVQFGTQA
jgi:hypothetical protein